ncbi:MAG: 4Fe-4S binding protein [Polyangiaceae bacterium]|nr:4Fe-4S binding protein [Polyangiaceae bacterium]MCW5789561.1 4Fe-4S binding protein [Polyangiaceae bacterium]
MQSTPNRGPTRSPVGDLPAPIPWLSGVGVVQAIDSVPTRGALSADWERRADVERRAARLGPAQPQVPPQARVGANGRRQLPVLGAAVASGAAAAPSGAAALVSAQGGSAPDGASISGDTGASGVGAATGTAHEPGGAGRQATSAVIDSPAPPAPKAAPKPEKPVKQGKKRPGSGIPARKIIRALVWVRRVSQVGFFALFLYLLFQTAFRGTFSAEAGEPVRLPYPVEAFLSADPFVAAMTFLSTHTVYRGMAWALVVLALTLVFGRVFCGWICPFGTMHHFFSWIFPSRYVKGSKRVNANTTKWWQSGKYYLMIAFLAAAAAGSAIGGLLDPICVAVRTIGLGVIPALQYLGLYSSSVVAESNVRPLQMASDSTQDFLAQTVWTSQQAYFHQTWFIVFTLVAILFMNRFIPRFWCRALCPLGAFLGVFSRFALFGMEKDHSKCTDCNLCLVDCQGADSPQGGVKHRQDECHMCLNCETACPEDVIKFRFLPNRKGTIQKPSLERRTALASAAAGAVTIPAMRIANWPDRAYSEKVIRPPGSVDEREFLERCIRCAECMKVCPNNALHPAFFEAGLEGLWTPILIPRIGYCEFSCVLCGQVCPTGAIQKIDEKQKMGIGQKPITLGTAMYDQGRCLPWAMATPCIVCEEFCPTSPKAIWAEELDVPKRESEYDGSGHAKMTTVRVQRPQVDPTLCIGCGACEKVCPIVDKPAVYVTNAGETRSKTNVILLENTSYS